jgi:DNA polymerase
VQKESMMQESVSDETTRTLLASLALKMHSCTDCQLCENRTKVVFGVGAVAPKPSVLIVGEAPGEDEDKVGIPFVGAAGQKLQKMLDFAGISRETNAYITNAVLCRPPGNRNPTHAELAACRHRLLFQIELLEPKLIIVLGRVATEQLKGHAVRGALKQFFKDEFYEFRAAAHTCKLIVTYHPSYHLRSPKQAYKETLPHWTKIKEWVASNG